MALILAGMWMYFRWQVGGFYFSGDSISNLSRDMATWTILAAGMTLVIVAGHIDLSVGSLLALVAASCAFMIDPEQGQGWSASIAVPLALLLGTALGFLQGVIVAGFRVPAFIVTLGGLFIFRGMTMKVGARDPRVPDESWVSALGFGSLESSRGWVLGLAFVCLLILFRVLGRRRRRRMDIPVEACWISAVKILVPSALVLVFIAKANQARGVPYQTLVMMAVIVAVYFVAKHTLFGRRAYAIGGNATAARLSGISVEKTTIMVFTLMGLLAGIAGVVWMAQNQGSTKNAGTFYELYAIAACVIGGTSLMGGRGTVFGTFLGALVMATVIQGMDYTDLENWLQLVVRGSVLIVAVAIDIATKNPPPWMLRIRETLIRRKSQDGV
jgi:D-xylose transport system permease protein